MSRCRYHVHVEMQAQVETAPPAGDNNLSEDFRTRIALRCPVMVDGRRCPWVEVQYDSERVQGLKCWKCRIGKVNCAGNLCAHCSRLYRAEVRRQEQRVLDSRRARSTTDRGGSAV